MQENKDIEERDSTDGISDIINIIKNKTDRVNSKVDSISKLLIKKAAQILKALSFFNCL